MAKRLAGPRRTALCAQFVAIVRVTGNARAAARALGQAHLFDNRMKRDPAFRAEVAAAKAEAEAGLAGAASPFLRPAKARAALPTDAAALGGYLRPGRKRRQTRPEPVIRRTSNGRLQVTAAREGHLTADSEADFLALLRATGNFSASARAIGFQPASLFQRMRTWPAFAAAVEEAIADAEVRIDFGLVGHAHALLRRPGEAAAAGIAEEEEVPFDPDEAMRILGFLDARRNGRTSRGPRKGPPERSLDEAVASILAKIDAIERHEARTGAAGAVGTVGTVTRGRLYTLQTR